LSLEEAQAYAPDTMTNPRVQRLQQRLAAIVDVAERLRAKAAHAHELLEAGEGGRARARMGELEGLRGELERALQEATGSSPD